MQTQELDFPDHVKPYVESIRGRWIPKVSPRKRHALIQLRLGIALLQWAAKRGDVGTEWRCRLLSSEEKPSSLVPDVCFVSNERQKDLSEEERERPPFAPDIAAEIWSPDDKLGVLHEKIELYFQFGSRLVIVVEPKRRTIAMYESASTHHAFGDGEIARCSAYPDLALDVSELLA